MAEREKRRPVRKFFKSFINVRRWVCYDDAKSYGIMVLTLAKNIFGIQKKEPIVETFAEAMDRLKLTEQDLVNKAQYFKRSAVMYLMIGLLFVAYAVYLLFDDYTILGVVVFILASLMFVYAYRESFWLMQIKRRKLGCTFKDWYQFVFLGKIV